MPHVQFPRPDLEAFQRWAIVVDDQLREAVDAMMALEYPEVEPPSRRRDVLSSDRSASDLASDFIKEITEFKDNPDRPAWNTAASQMVLVLAHQATFLFDYVDEVWPDVSSAPSESRVRLLDEKVFPALDQFSRFLNTVRNAGYLSNS
jgi:hypothetical protein